MNYPHTASISRMTEVSGKFVYGAVSTTPAFLQPIDNETAQLYSLVVSKSSVAYIPLASDIQEKDRLTIDGVLYGVKGVRPHNYGSLAHKKVVLEQL